MRTEQQSSLLLKVCGMRENSNILEIASLRPDYMGFIFYPKSPRYIGAAFEIPAAFPASIKRVGVFVNASMEEMISQAKRLQLDYLQLHGNEPVAQVEALRSNQVKVIKVFSVDDDFDFSITTPYRTLVDFFLFDTKGKYYGGNAQRFDWNILKRYDQQVPFFLSGGLSPDNIADIGVLKGMNIHALDINSGVELAPGLKSKAQIAEVQSMLHALALK
jgi:phosphoribosylanthranilate isomerase